MFLKNNQTSLSHATQETTLWVSPHPKNNSPIQNPLINLIMIFIIKSSSKLNWKFKIT
jgi:hypothetical protein